MNNGFKKTFCRKLGLSKLLVECENVVVTIRSNEKDADFQSRRKIPVCYIPNLPMLKTVAEYILIYIYIYIYIYMGKLDMYHQKNPSIDI
jgi:hypothetical protein